MPATLSCARCDGPVSGPELSQGLAVRLDGDLVCALCVDTLPEAIRAGIAKERRARGLAPVLRRMPHPARSSLLIYAFTDSAGLAQHRRAVAAGVDLVTVPLGGAAPSSAPPTPRWLTWAAVGGGSVVVAGLVAALVWPRTAPEPRPATPAPASPGPVAIPPAPRPEAPPVAVRPVPVVEPPASEPVAPVPPVTVPKPVAVPVAKAPVVPKPQAVPVPVPAPVAVPTSAPASAPVVAPVVPAKPEPVAAAPAPAPVAVPVVPAVDPSKDVLTLPQWEAGGKAAVAWAPHMQQAPPLPYPMLGDAPVTLFAADEDPRPGPWKGRKAVRLILKNGVCQDGGVVLAIHSGRIERKKLNVHVIDDSGKPIALDLLDVTNGWQAYAIPVAKDATLVISDIVGGKFDVTTPFWVAGGVVVRGKTPVVTDLAFFPSALFLSPIEKIKVLLEKASLARGKEAFNPLNLTVALESSHVKESEFKGWQTSVRKMLRRVYEDDAPYGTLVLRELFKGPREPVPPERKKCHLFVYGFEGEDVAFQPNELRQRIGVMADTLLNNDKKNPKVGGIIAVPIFGNALASTSPSVEWIEMRKVFVKDEKIFIDLREVPRERTGEALGNALVNLILHFQYLQIRWK